MIRIIIHCDRCLSEAVIRAPENENWNDAAQKIFTA